MHLKGKEMKIAVQNLFPDLYAPIGEFWKGSGVVSSVSNALVKLETKNHAHSDRHVPAKIFTPISFSCGRDFKVNVPGVGVSQPLQLREDAVLPVSLHQLDESLRRKEFPEQLSCRLPVGQDAQTLPVTHSSCSDIHT